MRNYYDILSYEEDFPPNFKEKSNVHDVQKVVNRVFTKQKYNKVLKLKPHIITNSFSIVKHHVSIP